MSDFILDLRVPTSRRARDTADYLRFCPETQVFSYGLPSLDLVLTRTDDLAIWGPYEAQDERVLVGLAGRVAFDAEVWERARQLPGEGGLACKAIYDLYRRGGTAALKTLNGNFFVILIDQLRHKLLLVTDRCGAYQGFRHQRAPVFSSHPDALANCTGESSQWDRTSISQFVATGQLTFPHTYYTNIEVLPRGTIFDFTLLESGPKEESAREYFSFSDIETCSDTPEEITESFADALTAAVRRRTLPLFGTTAIALSGGLDSRAILSAVGGASHIKAFTLHDKINAEVRTAQAVAEACHVPLELFQRDGEYYGSSMEQGVRISGATGFISTNHFLACREMFREHGFTNLVTGCYFDYLFKGLAFNTRESRFLRRKQLDAYSHEFYRPHYSIDNKFAPAVQARLDAQFPEKHLSVLSDEDWLSIVRKRVFPLAYECSSAQRQILQRVFPWSLPIVDNDLVDFFARLPMRSLLGSKLFTDLVQRICPPEVLRIRHVDTGSRVGAGELTRTANRYRVALLNQVDRKLTDHQHTRGSWLNWEYYLQHSQPIQELFDAARTPGDDLLSEIIGGDWQRQGYKDAIEHYPLELFMRLMTLKVWFQHRDSD